MPVSPVTTSPAWTSRVRFGGLADAVAGSVGVLENNRILELLSTDILGMCAPRTGIEAMHRGPDAARETAIRELMGLVGNLFVVGWISKLTMMGLGGRVNTYNPHGIPSDTWLNVRALDTLGGLYKEALAESANPAQARRKFIEKIFTEVISTDAKIGSAVFDKVGVQLDEAIRQGRLKPDVLAELIEHYQPLDKGRAFGTTPLNGPARELADKLSAAGQYTNLTKDDLYVRKRLQLSKQGLGEGLKDFLNEVDRKAKLGGLSDDVSLRGQVFKRRHLLEQTKHYLEQLIDRSADGLTQDPKWRTHIQERLFKESHASGKGIRKLLHRVWPSIEDGLSPALRKGKFLYTTVPVFLAAALSISVAFYNNYLTRKKYGGANFFPGEGGPQTTGQVTSQPPKTTAPQAGFVAGQPVTAQAAQPVHQARFANTFGRPLR